MKKILDKAASVARRSHAYRNHTRHLEESTFASELVSSGDEHSVEFGARAYYASFVEARGFQRVNDLASEAANEIEFFFDGEAESLSRL